MLERILTFVCNRCGFAILLNVALAIAVAILLMVPAEKQTWAYFCPPMNALIFIHFGVPVNCPPPPLQQQQSNTNTDSKDTQENVNIFQAVDIKAQEILADWVLRSLPEDELLALLNMDPLWIKNPTAGQQVIRKIKGYEPTSSEKCQAMELINEMNHKRLKKVYQELILLRKFHPLLVASVINQTAQQSSGCEVGYVSLDPVFNSDSDDIDEGILIEWDGKRTTVGLKEWRGSHEFRIGKADQWHDGMTENGEQCFNRETIVVQDMYEFEFCIMWKGTEQSQKNFVALSVNPISSDQYSKESNDKCEVRFQTICTKSKHDCRDYHPKRSSKLEKTVFKGEIVEINFCRWNTLKEEDLGLDNALGIRVDIKCTQHPNYGEGHPQTDTHANSIDQ